MSVAIKFKTILSKLQMKIISGEWGEGFKMPTEMELCELYGVSRVTIRRALEQLVAYGYITRTRGRGSFVLFNREVVDLTCSQCTDKDKMIKGRYKILLKEKLYSTAVDREQMGEDDPNASTHIWHVKTLHLVGDKATVLSDYYLSDRFAEPLLLMQEYSDESIFEILSNHYGQRCSFAKGKVGAIIPNEEVAKYLQLDPLSAHLWCRGMCVLDDGSVVGRCTKIFDGLTYEFALEPSHGSLSRYLY